MRRWIAVSAVILSLALLVAGCGSSSEPAGNTGAGRNPGSSGAAPDGGAAAPDSGVIRVAVSSDPSNWDMDFTQGDVVALSLNTNVYPYLFDHPLVPDNQEGFLVRDTTQLVGVYAEDYEISEDGTVWTVRLKQGLQFPDGTPVTAQAFRWSKERGLSFGANLSFAYGLIGIESPDQIEVVDDYTLRFHHDRFSSMQSYMHVIGSWFYNPELLTQHATGDDIWATQWQAKNPAVGGPYQVAEVVPGQRIVLEKNPYWPGEVANERVEILIVPSAATQYQMLQRGDIDLALGLGRRDAASMRGLEGIKVLSIPTIDQLYLVPNHQMPPFDNKFFRQAIAYAIPYDEIVNQIYSGDAIRGDSVVPNGMPGYTAAYAYQTDLAKARELLAASGVTDPRVTLTIVANNREHEEVALLIQSRLAEVGIAVDIDRLDPTAMAQQLTERRLAFALHGGIMWINDPEYLISANFLPDAYLNYGAFSHPRIDEIVAELAVTQDQAQRIALADEAQRILMDELAWIPLAQPNYLVAIRDDVTGFAYSHDQLFRLWTLSRR